MRDRTLTLLFRRYRERGDGRALAAVFDATAKELLDLACHLVRDPSEAEDLVQATFLTAIRKSGRYDESAPVQAWLYGILWREGARARRRAARVPDPRRLERRAEPDPLEVLAEGEVPAAVAAALRALPPRYREVLEPLLFDGKRADAIASDLARSAGTVRSQIHRGLEELRRSLAPRFAVHGALLLSTRGLGQVRASVLRAAGFPPATAATPPAVLLALATGGMLVSKTVLAVTAAAAVILTGTWIVLARATPVTRGADPAATAAVVSSASDPVPSGDALAARAAPAEPPARESTVAGAPAPARSFDQTVAYWLGRFGEAPEDWRHGWDITAEIAKLPPDEALAIMTAVWPHLSVPVKEQALKPFVFDGGHPRALAVLHLAATDAAASVQERAFGYLCDYAFQDFALDYDAYLAWSAANEKRPLADVLADSARQFVSDMLALAPAQRAERVLGALRGLDLSHGGPAGVDLAAVMRAAGGERMLELCLADADPEVQARALRWSETLAADERWLRTWVVPAVEQPDGVHPAVLDASLAALGRADCVWARDAVLAHLERATRAPVDGTKTAGRALAEMGDPAAIPRMIAILLRDTTGALNYDVGYFGLAKLTGVTWQKSYDGAWWAEWWRRSRARFPAEVAALEVER